MDGVNLSSYLRSWRQIGLDNGHIVFYFVDSTYQGEAASCLSAPAANIIRRVTEFTLVNELSGIAARRLLLLLAGSRSPLLIALHACCAHTQCTRTASPL
jgi:hypothetical protein